MTIDYLTGIDEIFTHGKSVFDAASLAVLGASAPVAATGEEWPEAPGNAFWGRLSVETVSSKQAIVGMLDNSGTTRYRSRGILLIEVFAPKVATGNAWKAREICSRMRALTVAATTPGKVYFENVRVEDSAKTNAQWLSYAMWAEWTLDEVI